MKDYEYKELWQKGQKEFYSINHDRALEKMIAKDLSFIIHFPEQSLDEIKNYQLEQLKKLVDYAYLNIPLYKEKYDKIGYKIGDIKTFEDFEKLPILYKDELIEGFPNKLVKNIQDFKYSTRSSGSSGKFVTLALDFESIYKDTLQGIRQYVRQSGFEYKKENKVLFIYTCPWWIKEINGNYHQYFLSTTTDVKVTLDFIKKNRPFIISTYPTYLQSICELKVKLCDYGVKYIIVHSEQSTETWRKEMAIILGVKVIDEYSSEELTRIALECDQGVYHLEEDACYIEVVDSQTKKKIENGVGSVIGTNLINKATPIIRYWQGDLVTIESHKKCSCGNNARIITKIQGREMDCIVSDGKSIPASSFMDIAYNWFLKDRVSIMGMRYQIVQMSEHKIVIYLQKGVYELMKNDLDKIKESLYSIISRKIKVEIIFTDEFIQNTAKFKAVLKMKF